MLMSPVRASALTLLLLGGFAGPLAAQTPKPQPPAPKAAAPPPGAPASPPAAPPSPPAAPAPLVPETGIRVMVVDVQALLEHSKAAKMVRSQIEQKRAEYTKEISREEEGLRAERDALQRQQASLSAAALNKKGREFQQKVNDLDRNVQSKRQALEKSNNEALSRIQQEMIKIIADIAKRRKANLVFQRSDLVLFDRSFDVTDEVLQKLDEKLPVMTVNFVNPTPTPAAAASRNASTKSRRK